MTNPFIIFWQWLNPFSKRKKKRDYTNVKEWLSSNAVSLMKTALVTVLLIFVSVYYVKCYEVPIHSTAIDLYRINDNIGHTIALPDISIVRDYNLSNWKTKPASGMYIGVRMYKRDKGRNPLPYFSQRNLEANRHGELVQLGAQLKEDFPDAKINWDSARYVYKLIISSSVNTPFLPYYSVSKSQRNLIDTTFTGYGEWVEGANHSQASYTEGATFKDKTFVSDVWLFSDKMICQASGSTTFNINESGAAYRLYSPFWLNAIDVTRAIETFKMKDPFDTGAYRIGSLNFSYGGTAEFSAINPQPDIITYNSIEFTDSAKLAYINHSGLTFHVKFPDMENKQQARTFAVTTILTLLVTLLLKLLYDITLDFWRWLYLKHKRLVYWMAGIVIAMPLLYLLLTLYT